MSWFEVEPESDWGAGLQYPDRRFPVGVEVVVRTTMSGQKPDGTWVLVVADEVGRVSREGSSRVLVRMDRRHRPFSIYLPILHLTPIERSL